MTTADPQFEGVYGIYTITDDDRREVKLYRLALLMSGLSFSAGMVQWWQLGPAWAWLWVIPLASAIGLALNWIHIYLRPLHRALQLFWLMGCGGWILLFSVAGTDQALAGLNSNPVWILAIGPLFAALAGPLQQVVAKRAKWQKRVLHSSWSWRWRGMASVREPCARCRSCASVPTF